MLSQSHDPNSPDAFPFPPEVDIALLLRTLGSVPPEDFRSVFALGTGVCADTTLNGEPVRISIGISNLHRLGSSLPDARYREVQFVDVCRIISREGGKALERLYFDYHLENLPDEPGKGIIAAALYPRVEGLIEARLPAAPLMKIVPRELSHELLFGDKKEVSQTAIKSWSDILPNSGVEWFVLSLPSGEAVPVVVAPESVEPGVVVAQLFRTLIDPLEKPVVGNPTGATAISFYAELVKMHAEGWSSINRIQSFNLDEYFGLSAHNKASFVHYMNVHLFNHVDIPASSIFFPTADTSKNYSQMIKDAGGFDVVIGGIGLNGHFAYNEPGSSFTSRTRCIALEESSRRSTIGDFGGVLEQVPEKAYTVGMADILEARSVIMAASGQKKIPILKTALFGPVTELCPSSILRTHPNFLLVVDREIAHALRS